MKLINKKVKAFTISEMLIVLVISSLVVSLSLIVLNLIQKQIKSIEKNYVKNNEKYQLERALTYDFERYDLFYYSRNNELKGTSVKDSVVYSFTEKFVLRNKDTLNIHIQELIFYLDGNKVSKGAIDAVELQLSKEVTEKKIFIAKTKDAAFYMNNYGI